MEARPSKVRADSGSGSGPQTIEPLSGQVTALGEMSKSDPTFDLGLRAALRQPCDFIQLYQVKEKAKEIEKEMKDLETLTNILGEMSDPCESDEEQKFLDTLLKLKEHIQSVFAFVDLILIERMHPKQQSVLREIRSQRFNPALDISIRYLGLSWEEMRSLVATLQEQLDELCTAILASKRPRLVLSSNIIRNLSKIREDLVSHAEATLNGRLNRVQNDRIRAQQEHHRDFLERLKRRQSRPLIEFQSHHRLSNLRKLLPPWPRRSASSPMSRGRPLEAMKEEDEDKAATAEELGLLWQHWYEGMAHCSKIVSQVSHLNLTETPADLP